MSNRPHPTMGDGWRQIDVGHGKKRKREAYKGTKEEADEYELLLKKNMRPTVASCAERVSVLLDRYLESYKIDHRVAGYNTQVIRCHHLRPFFGKMLLQYITAQDIDRYKQHRISGGVKPTTINKELCALSGLFKWAEEMGVIDAAPCRIKKFPGCLTVAPVPHIPTWDEIDRILAEVSAKKRGLFTLMFYLGLRRSEALNLKDTDVNLERCTLTVTGKGGRQRTLPIVNQDMLDELKERCKNTKSGYLWESPLTDGPYKDIRGSLKSAAKRAGVDGRVYAHLLRHAAGTETLEGGDLRDVQVMLGHTTSKTTEIYTHVRQDRLRRVMMKRRKPIDT